MISGFIAQKGNMTSIFTEDGKRVSVTRCVAKPLIVTQIKTKEKDGYDAIQLASGSKKNLSQAISKKLSKLKLDIKPSIFKEFELTGDQTLEVGASVAIDSVFTKDDQIDVTGISKGHGFAGVIKRHGFKKQPILGSSNYVRHPGSIGAQTPGKVVKGKKMPGHFGVETTTVSGLKVFSVNPENNEILIKGSVPGAINSWLIITKK